MILPVRERERECVCGGWVKFVGRTRCRHFTATSCHEARPRVYILLTHACSRLYERPYMCSGVSTSTRPGLGWRLLDWETYRVISRTIYLSVVKPTKFKVHWCLKDVALAASLHSRQGSQKPSGLRLVPKVRGYDILVPEKSKDQSSIPLARDACTYLDRCRTRCLVPARLGGSTRYQSGHRKSLLRDKVDVR